MQFSILQIFAAAVYPKLGKLTYTSGSTKIKRDSERVARRRRSLRRAAKRRVDTHNTKRVRSSFVHRTHSVLSYLCFDSYALPYRAASALSFYLTHSLTTTTTTITSPSSSFTAAKSDSSSPNKSLLIKHLFLHLNLIHNKLNELNCFAKVLFPLVLQ